MVTAHSKVSTAKTAGSLIDEIKARHTIETIRDDDVTIRKLIEKTGLGKTKCETILAEEVKAGRLVEVIVLTDGNRKTRAWRKKDAAHATSPG